MLDAAAEEIDWELEYTDETPAPTPPPPSSSSVNLDRAVEHWRQGQSPFGVIGDRRRDRRSSPRRNTWYRHASEAGAAEGA